MLDIPDRTCDVLDVPICNFLPFAGYTLYTLYTLRARAPPWPGPTSTFMGLCGVTPGPGVTDTTIGGCGVIVTVQLQGPVWWQLVKGHLLNSEHLSAQVRLLVVRVGVRGHL